MKTLRNIVLAAATAALGIGAAFAQDTAKPAARPDASNRHGQHAHQPGQHGHQGGCHSGEERGGERHEHQNDEKHEHDQR